MGNVDLVTGAFGYTGSFITERLLAGGRHVRTLTRRSGDGHRLAAHVEAMPLRFDDGATLVAALDGVDTLYNTYWRRFPGAGTQFADVVEQSAMLIEAASKAGVRRVVHFSVSNASDDAPTPYFRAKAQVERIVRESGLAYAIVRPTFVYGPGDILINNLAWALRRLPLFAMPGSGDFPVQPVLVTDLADLAARLAEAPDDVIVTAAGPDNYRFGDLVRLVRDTIRARARIVGVPPAIALAGWGVMGRIVRDIVLTRDEITELMAGLLVSPEPATCPTPFSEWLDGRAHEIGRRYASELARNYR